MTDTTADTPVTAINLKSAHAAGIFSVNTIPKWKMFAILLKQIIESGVDREPFLRTLLTAREDCLDERCMIFENTGADSHDVSK